MKIAAYIYGLLCVSIAIFAVIAFVLLFVSQALVGLLSVSIQKGSVVGLLVMSGAAALAYFTINLSRLKKVGLPETFVGWRVILVWLGFGALLLGAIPVVFALVQPKASGGLSGVPLGLGFIFSFLLTVPSMSGRLWSRK